MELITASHSSYPRVGDSHDLQLLRRTLAQRDRGEKTDADVEAAEARLTELALQDQIDAGVNVVTDGQIRWYDPVSHLAGKLQGARINGLLRFFDTNFYFRQPVAEAKPRRTGPMVVGDFQFARAKTALPVKAVLTGPYTLARLSLAAEGTSLSLADLVDGYTTALAEEVEALAEAGATLIQVDEPALLRYPTDFAAAASSVAALAARKGPAALLLALYFGDPAPLYDKLQQLPAEILGLDFTYNPGLVDLVSTAGSSKQLAAGLLDGRNTRVEEIAPVAGALERILRSVEARPLYLTTSCGLEYLPRDRARLKLQRLAGIPRAFLGQRSHA